jgi:hypothetical protein
VSLFVRHVSQDMAGLGGPPSSQTAAGIAFEFTGARKLPQPANYPFINMGTSPREVLAEQIYEFQHVCNS